MADSQRAIVTKSGKGAATRDYATILVPRKITLGYVRSRNENRSEKNVSPRSRSYECKNALRYSRRSRHEHGCHHRRLFFVPAVAGIGGAATAGVSDLQPGKFYFQRPFGIDGSSA